VEKPATVEILQAGHAEGLDTWGRNPAYRRLIDMTAETAGAAATEAGDDLAQALDSRLRGRLVRPTDDDYDEARLVWNGMVDKRPALIMRCAGVADVIHRRQLRAGAGLARGRAWGRSQRGR
jgi:hypothetical protein